MQDNVRERPCERCYQDESKTLDDDRLTGSKAKRGFKIQVANQAVNSSLAMPTLDFRENQFGAVAVVTAAQADLDLQEFPGFFESHVF